MIRGLSHVSLMVKDQDEAVKWYTEKLGLEVRADVKVGDEFRWLTVGSPEQPSLEIVLHPPRGEEQTSQVGKQWPGVFNSGDCRADTETFRGRGVKIVSEPEDVMWGVQSMFEDLYGNTYVMVQPPNA